MVNRNIIRLGTRGSLLAVTQSKAVATMLAPLLAGKTIELLTITTSGDKQTDKPLAASGGKGLFVKEIEEQLLDGRIDLAVHSAKDLPIEIPADLQIIATPPRETPNDVWIGHQTCTIQNLPQGACVGTSSMRRQAQLLAMRQDLSVIPLRGNIDTRLRKVSDGVVAGTFLAAAGLKRTNLLPPQGEVMPTDQFIPAAGQGTLAIQIRRSDAELAGLLGHLDHAPTRASLAFERAIVRRLAGNCLAPIGVCAEPRVNDDGWIVRAFIATPDGRQFARATLLSANASTNGLNALFEPLLQSLMDRGAGAIMQQISAIGPPSA
ncbi:MAG: hydroxymethylbilane synthase [Phycisphaerales bacterium]|nr:hydroxymethylbilane synthase [Phycisphaerales bacterium]